jgi:hypothetical protein
MDSRKYAPWLTLLTGLFAFRVFAQLATLQFSIPYLPEFEAWHSGSMPYGLLVFFQFLILGLMIRTSIRASRNRLAGTAKLGRFLWGFGLVYVALMLTRLILGQTLLEEYRFFANTITTSFHFVLAAFVLITAHILKQKNNWRMIYV